MKSIIAYTLFFAILLQAAGCYSYYPLEKNESVKDYLKVESHLEFRLKNGDKFQCGSKECSFIEKPGNYIFGVGTIANKTTQAKKEFRGEVNISSVGSVKEFTMGSIKYVSYLLKDSSRILFEKSNVMNITSDSTPDFWIIMKGHSPKMIYNSDIKWIQIEKLNTEKTIMGGVIFAALLFIFYKAMANLNFGIGGLGLGGSL